MIEDCPVCGSPVIWDEFDSDEDVYLGHCQESRHPIRATDEDETWK